MPTTYAHGGQIDYGKIRENLQSLGLPTDAGDRTLLVEEINERYNIDCGEVIRGLSDDDVYVAVDGVLRDYGVYASDGYVDDYTKGYAKGGLVVGDYVEIVSDNDSYDDFRDEELIIESISDDGDGENMYELAYQNDDTEIPFSFYEYELEKIYAKGGKVKKKQNNEMLIGGIAGILLGIFLKR